MVEKLKMESKDIIQENIEFISQRFPNTLKETRDENGNLVKKIDFDVLKQELSNVLIDDKKERYQMTWPGKKESILLANSKTNKTLRPAKEKSVDFENTKNIYIEGDSLEALKLLRETYLGKIKIIYIDPPYNTGKDFIYKDNFHQNYKEYLEDSGQVDEVGNRMFTNNESDGKFHTNWLNMIYKRIKLARDLLTDDGVIFISIDDREVNNLRKICDEIFSETNFVNCISLEITPSSGVKRAHKDKMYIKNTEFVLVYRKSNKLEISPLYDEWENYDKHYSIYFDGNEYSSVKNKIKNIYPNYSLIKIENFMLFEDIKKFLYKESEHIFRTHDASAWAIDNVSEEKILYNKERKIYKIYNPSDKDEFELLVEVGANKFNRLEPLSWNLINNKIQTLRGDLWLNFDKDMGNVSKEGDIPYPNGKKPLRLLTDIISSTTSGNDIVLDFFSGSGTTGHAVFENNFKCNNKNKFILVQIPQEIDYSKKENIKMYAKFNFKTICDIGEERIRRAGKKIKEENPLAANFLDTGFRVLKLDSSNMNEIYYNPKDVTPSLLENTIDNVKTDRSSLDLLFQVMLELGIELSSKISEKEINGKKYYLVNDNDIIACFDDELDNDLLTEIAKLQPVYAVFKNTSFANDNAMINCEQIFKTYHKNYQANEKVLKII